MDVFVQKVTVNLKTCDEPRAIILDDINIDSISCTSFYIMYVSVRSRSKNTAQDLNAVSAPVKKCRKS